MYFDCTADMGRNLKINNHPISLFLIFGAMLEKFMFDGLYNHYISNNLLNPNQLRSLPGYSMMNQLLSIARTILAAFDCNPLLDVCLVYLDISRAVDRIGMKALFLSFATWSIM